MQFEKWARLTPGQRAAYRLGLVVSLVGVVALLAPGREDWHAGGPHSTGHTKIRCIECHAEAPGNFAGQALNNMLYAVGLSDSESDFIYQAVDKERCLYCHELPNDRHPVAKFLAPEFAAAREAAGVQSCLNCHLQHLGVRVTASSEVCQHCHQDTALAEDPVDISHVKLIDDGRWQTCLGCHDFHGNHERTTPKRMSEVLTENEIQQYFDGGDSPYGPRSLSAIETRKR